MPIEMQKEFKLVVGKEKLEKLGITLPEDLMNKATMIQYLTGKELHMNWKKRYCSALSAITVMAMVAGCGSNTTTTSDQKKIGV